MLTGVYFLNPDRATRYSVSKVLLVCVNIPEVGCREVLVRKGISPFERAIPHVCGLKHAVLPRPTIKGLESFGNGQSALSQGFLHLSFLSISNPFPG